MKKIFNKKILYIFLGILGVVLLVLVLIKSFVATKVVVATITPQDLKLGDAIFFTDSTQGAKEWLWEFGDGMSSSNCSGNYTFSKIGTYKVRLTINGNLEHYFEVRVKDNTFDSNHLVTIAAPKKAVQGEYIVFRGEGSDEQWRWAFGETGMIDAREKSTIYAYQEPGVYDVTLSTENTRYPIHHQIIIVPRYVEDDSTDILSLINADIKAKLQAICNGQSFNTNYNYIVSKYLCGNERTEVVINNNKYNDIYSYCQGLRIAGIRKTYIDQVVVEVADMSTGCITKINVIQTDKK